MRRQWQGYAIGRHGLLFREGDVESVGVEEMKKWSSISLLLYETSPVFTSAFVCVYLYTHSCSNKLKQVPQIRGATKGRWSDGIGMAWTRVSRLNRRQDPGRSLFRLWLT